MTHRIPQIALGVVLYIALVVSLYALSLVAFPDGGGPIPIWFASAQILIEAAASVIPGVLVGWLCREHGLKLGAVTGALGSIAGNIAQFNLWGVAPMAEFSLHLGVGAVSMVLAASITNAVGGVAGAALGSRLQPDYPSLNRVDADNPHVG